MAIVRRWQRQAESTALAPPRPVERDTSGLRVLAQGVGQVADAAAAISNKELADARRTRETAAANQLRSARVTLEDAAGQAKGRVALEVDLLGGATKELQAQADKLAEEAGDPVLAEQIRAHHRDQEFQLTHSIRTHIAGQADDFALKTHKDALEGADLDAQRAAQIDDTDGVLAAVERKAGAIRREAARLGRDGASDDYLRTELPAQLGLLHAGVISTLNSGDHPQPKKAALYLNAHRSEMSPALANKIEKELLGDVQEEEGANVARVLVSESINSATGHFDYGSAKTKLDAFLASDASPAMKKAATAEFQAASGRTEKAFAAKVNDQGDLAMTKIGNAGYSLAAARAELKWLRREDVGQGQLADAIEARVRNIIEERSKPGPPNKAQKLAMVDFYLSLPGKVNAYASNPESFKQEWWGRLNEADLRTASGTIAQLGMAARKPDETLPTTVIAAVTALGAKTNKWGKTGPKDENQKLLFYGLTSALLKEQARLKVNGPVKEDDLVAFARKRLVEGTAYTLTGDEETGVTELDIGNQDVNPGLAGSTFISDEDRKRYEGKLRSELLPVTKDWVLYFHRKEQGEDKPPFTEDMKRQLEAADRQKEANKKASESYFKAGEYSGRTR